MQGAAYLLVLCASSVLSGCAYHFLWSHFLPGLSRPHMFFLSFGLGIVVLFTGVVTENRYLWKGFFMSAEENRNGYGPRPGQSALPFPLSLGTALGVLSFLGWS